jgi:hypothetical protein
MLRLYKLSVISVSAVVKSSFSGLCELSVSAVKSFFSELRFLCASVVKSLRRTVRAPRLCG